MESRRGLLLSLHLGVRMPTESGAADLGWALRLRQPEHANCYAGVADHVIRGGNIATVRAPPQPPLPLDRESFHNLCEFVRFFEEMTFPGMQMKVEKQLYAPGQPVALGWAKGTRTKRYGSCRAACQVKRSVQAVEL